MSRVLTYVSINGIDVSSYVVSWECKETFGHEIPDSSIVLAYTVENVIVPDNGQLVVIKRGAITGQENNVFKGYVDLVNKKIPVYEIKAKNMLQKLVKTDVNYSYDKNLDPSAGVISEIIKDLIVTHAGMSADATTIINSGTDLLIDKFVCRKTDVFERINALTSVIDYQLYYDYDDDKVYCEPTGYNTNSNNLIVGTNVSNVPKWNFDNSQLVNQIRVEGAEQMIETTENGQIGVTSGYTTSSVTLLNKPFSTKVYVDAANPPTTLRKGGIQGSTASFQYSVDTENSKIVWNTGTYTPGVNDYCQILYTHPVPVPIIRKDDVSIGLYGLSSTVKHFSDVQTVEDAMKRASLYLATYAYPFVRVTCHVPAIMNNYEAGESVKVIDLINNEDRTLTINSVTKSFPHKFDVLEIGDKEYKISEFNSLILNRLKRIEEQFSKNDDVLIDIRDFTNDLYLVSHYLQILKNGVIAGVVWSGNKYVEDFKDTDFKHADTDANWDVTNERLSYG